MITLKQTLATVLNPKNNINLIFSAECLEWVIISVLISLKQKRSVNNSIFEVVNVFFFSIKFLAEPRTEREEKWNFPNKIQKYVGGEQVVGGSGTVISALSGVSSSSSGSSGRPVTLVPNVNESQSRLLSSQVIIHVQATEKHLMLRERGFIRFILTSLFFFISICVLCISHGPKYTIYSDYIIFRKKSSHANW